MRALDLDRAEPRFPALRARWPTGSRCPRERLRYPRGMEIRQPGLRSAPDPASHLWCPRNSDSIRPSSKLLRTRPDPEAPQPSIRPLWISRLVDVRSYLL